MISIIKPIISRLQVINFIQNISLCLLLSSAPNLWAKDQVDLMTQEPILVYTISHQTLSENDSQKIEVYSDGYVVLHYPSYMKKAGDYSIQLSADNFQHLIETLEKPSVKNFDDRDIQKQVKALDKVKGDITFVSDTSYSSFEVSRSDGNGKQKAKQKIKCPNLQYDAKQHPGINALKHLAEVESILSKLIEQSDIQEFSDD